LIRVSTTLPESARLPRIAAAARLLDEAPRTDVSAVIGLDVDLILGYEYTLPEGATEAEEAEALLAAFGEEYARVAALVDMIDTGFVNIPQAYGRLLVLADELECADNVNGYELDEGGEVLGGWAA
jgi:hypothetical protein